MKRPWLPSMSSKSGTMELTFVWMLIVSVFNNPWLVCLPISSSIIQNISYSKLLATNLLIIVEKSMNIINLLYELDDLAKFGMNRFINEVSLERFVAFKRQQTDILMGIWHWIQYFILIICICYFHLPRHLQGLTFSAV